MDTSDKEAVMKSLKPTGEQKHGVRQLQVPFPELIENMQCYPNLENGRPNRDGTKNQQVNIAY